MKTLIGLALCLSLIGCGTAQLVSTRYKPHKAGTVKMSKSSYALEQQAMQIMTKFCAPQRYDVTGTDTVTEIDGAYSSGYGNLYGTSYEKSNSPMLHFECVDGPAPSSL